MKFTGTGFPRCFTGGGGGVSPLEGTASFVGADFGERSAKGIPPGLSEGHELRCEPRSLGAQLAYHQTCPAICICCA